MDTARLKPDLDNIFDQALIFHGFTSYMRDYEMFAYCTADPRTGIAPEHLATSLSCVSLLRREW